MASKDPVPAANVIVCLKPRHSTPPTVQPGGFLPLVITLQNKSGAALQDVQLLSTGLKITGSGAKYLSLTQQGSSWKSVPASGSDASNVAPSDGGTEVRITCNINALPDSFNIEVDIDSLIYTEVAVHGPSHPTSNEGFLIVNPAR